jgi:probable HAF family extracellular repeat protein
MIVPFAGRMAVMQDLGTLPGGGGSAASGVSADGARGGRLGLTITSTTPRRVIIIVPFAGRLLVGCKTSARWAAIIAAAFGVSADGAVVVGGARNAAGYDRAFRWTNG